MRMAHLETPVATAPTPQPLLMEPQLARPRHGRWRVKTTTMKTARRFQHYPMMTMNLAAMQSQAPRRASMLRTGRLHLRATKLLLR